MKIAHIVNILDVQPKHEPSYLHIAQPVTLKSMLNAKLKSKNPENIDLIAIKHKEDSIDCPEGFRMAPELTRFCYDVFPEIPTTWRSLPLITDIFDSLNQASTADYFIYTNVDIGLFPDFYDRVYNIVKKHGYEYFCIDRETMPEYVGGELIDQHNFEQLFNIKGGWHPGTDCFVFKKDLLIDANFGHAFIGEPPIAGLIDSVLDRQYADFLKHSEWRRTKVRLDSRRDYHFKSGNRYTFHLGVDSAWRTPSPFSVLNFKVAWELGQQRLIRPYNLRRKMCRILEENDPTGSRWNTWFNNHLQQHDPSQAHRRVDKISKRNRVYKRMIDEYHDVMARANPK